MASYATPAQLKAWLSAGTDSAVTFTSDDNAALQLLLDTATTFIDQYTERAFVAEDGATKILRATYPDRLALPDIREVTSAAYDTNGNGTFSADLAEGDDFYLTPLDPRPDAGIYTGLQLTPQATHRFRRGRRVRIIGDWGYVVSGAAPPNVQTACLLLAARYWTRKGAPLGIIQNTDIGTFRSISKMDPDVATLLDPYAASAAETAAARAASSGLHSVRIGTATASRGVW